MKIEIFSDTVCPWCRIGKRNLFHALEQLPEEEQVTVRWRAFQLDPTIPLEGKPYKETMESKFGADGRLDQIVGQVCRVGEECGVSFDFANIDYLPNTLLSHQLIQITPQKQQTAVVDAIMKAYFEDGRNIGDLDVLVNLAEESGLDADIIRHRLTNKEGIAEVEEDIEFASRVRISGVPYFIINDRYAISGAQPVQAFLQAFERIRTEQE